MIVLRRSLGNAPRKRDEGAKKIPPSHVLGVNLHDVVKRQVKVVPIIREGNLRAIRWNGLGLLVAVASSELNRPNLHGTSPRIANDTIRMMSIIRHQSNTTPRIEPVYQPEQWQKRRHVQT